MVGRRDKTDTQETLQPDKRFEVHWYLSIVPLNIAIGSSGILTTLVALSLGANVADLGVMTAAGAGATIILSSVWGKMSDSSGNRKKFLLLFFAALGPIFLVLSATNYVLQLIVIYALMAVFTSGIAPIATMYTVENCKAKDWQNSLARYNSMTSFGTIIGLVANTIVATFFQTHWLFYISAAMCFIAAFVLMITGREPGTKLERHHFPVIHFRHAERFHSPRPIFHTLDMHRLRAFMRKPHISLSPQEPLHLLFLACFVHWTGIFFYGVGQTPLMKDLGLSDSAILAINALTNVASAVAFIKIAPLMKHDHKSLLRNVVVGRVGLIFGWAALPIFLIRPSSLAFVFPMALSVAFTVFYAMIWMPITTFAISQAPEHHKGVVQGELLSIIALANVVGSTIGGLVITSLGYTVGFVLAAIIALLMIPIISRIDTI
jgi:MFS family permease